MADIFLRCAAQFLAVLYVFGEAEAACPPTGPNDATVVIDYNPINQSDYDRNYSSITSGRHPLGFYSDVWYYNQNKPNPCIKITAPQASVRRIDIKVETVPDSRLCFKDQQADSQICFQTHGTVCRPTPGNNIYIEFLCDASCEEADVNFWYRLVLSPLPSEEDPETWCLKQPEEYPSDLLNLPDKQTLPTRTTPRPRDDTGAAFRQPASLSLLLAVVMCACILFVTR